MTPFQPDEAAIKLAQDNDPDIKKLLEKVAQYDASEEARMALSRAKAQEEWADWRLLNSQLKQLRKQIKQQLSLAWEAERGTKRRKGDRPNLMVQLNARQGKVRYEEIRRQKYAWIEANHPVSMNPISKNEKY